MKMRRMDRTGRVRGCGDEARARRRAADRCRLKATIAPGVILGTWTAGGGSTQIFLDALFRPGPRTRRRCCSTARSANSAASLVGLEFKLRGPNMTVSHKEASGLAAIVAAVDLLRDGRASA